MLYCSFSWENKSAVLVKELEWFLFKQISCLLLLCQYLTLFTSSVTELGGPLSRRKAARRWKAGMHTCLPVQSLDDIRIYIWVCWSTRLFSRTYARSFVKTTWYSTIVNSRQMSPMLLTFSSCSYFCVDWLILQCSPRSSQIIQADSTEFKVQFFNDSFCLLCTKLLCTEIHDSVSSNYWMKLQQYKVWMLLLSSEMGHSLTVVLFLRIKKLVCICNPLSKIRQMMYVMDQTMGACPEDLRVFRMFNNMNMIHSILRLRRVIRNAGMMLNKSISTMAAQNSILLITNCDKGKWRCKIKFEGWFGDGMGNTMNMLEI